MRHLFTVVVAVALMLSGAALLVSGSTSALSYAAIAVGISLTVIDLRQQHPGR